MKLVVPLTFGKDVDLGWDPTMELKYDNQLSELHYEMTVTPIDNPVRKYHSARVLCERIWNMPKLLALGIATVLEQYVSLYAIS